MYSSNTYIISYGEANYIYLTNNKGNTSGPSRGVDGIAKLGVGKQKSRQGHLIEEVQHNKKSNFHQMIHP